MCQSTVGSARFIAVVVFRDMISKRNDPKADVFACSDACSSQDLDRTFHERKEIVFCFFLSDIYLMGSNQKGNEKD
jgi:hypothetical protein